MTAPVHRDCHQGLVSRSCPSAKPHKTSTDRIGMEVHQEAIAVAYVAQDRGATVVFPGTVDTRPCDIEQLIRQIPSKATPLIFVDEAGPCSSWRYRCQARKGHIGRAEAPSLIPQKADNRDAIQ